MGETKEQTLSLKQGTPGLVSGPLNAGYYSKNRNAFEGRLVVFYIQLLPPVTCSDKSMQWVKPPPWEGKETLQGGRKGLPSTSGIRKFLWCRGSF